MKRLLLGLALLITGCGENGLQGLGGDPGPAPSATVAALADSSEGARVSLDGSVAWQEDARRVILDDETGHLRIIFPDDVRLADGQRLTVTGRIADGPQGASLEAEAWAYDSTATPVRSPRP